MCTMVLKDSLAYYDGGAAFCTFTDATKALIVSTIVLFSILLKRDIPAAYVRLLLNLYTNSVTRVSWNGVCSKRFPVKNGMRQAGIISPILSCVYIDGLLVLAVTLAMSSLEHWLTLMMWYCLLLNIAQCVAC